MPRDNDRDHGEEAVVEVGLDGDAGTMRVAVNHEPLGFEPTGAAAVSVGWWVGGWTLGLSVDLERVFLRVLRVVWVAVTGTSGFCVLLEFRRFFRFFLGAEGADISTLGGSWGGIQSPSDRFLDASFQKGCGGRAVRADLLVVEGGGG
jgi:hypothetical protein